MTTGNTFPRKSIEVATDWWVAQLQGEAVQDNGDETQSSFVRLMTLMSKPVSDEWLAAFRENLILEVEKEFNQYPNTSRVRLDNDYNPLGALAEAKDAADRITGEKVLDSRFPMKTSMSIYPDGRVTVSNGYHAESKLLTDGTTVYQQEPVEQKPPNAESLDMLIKLMDFINEAKNR